MTRPTAYSYVRFSSGKQALGHSLRRQVEGAEAYCAANKLDLHPVSYRDLGVSAFKRKNIEKGALAAFIDAVQSGKVARGSYLIIEQFDRMSRADANKALLLLLQLVEAGIKVVTLIDGKVWDEKSVKDHTNLILAIVYMSRANDESAAKAERLSKVWAHKKKQAAEGTATRIVTSECPRWLRAKDDKTGFVVRPDEVASIRKVFEMRINGFGIVAIVNKANKERWPAPGKTSVRKPGESDEDFVRRKAEKATWHTSTVARLLKNRALLGEYQPRRVDADDDSRRLPAGDPIPGYYPAVIDETTFLRAQAVATRRGRFPGRRDPEMRNWLQGLVRCSCGHSLVRKNKNSKGQPNYSRYYCTARVRGVSKCPSVSTPELEGAVLTAVGLIAGNQFASAQADELKARVDALEAQVALSSDQLARYVEAIGMSGMPVRSLVQKLEETDSALLAQQKELAETRAALADISVDHDEILERLFLMAAQPGGAAKHAALREELARIVSQIVVHQDGHYIRVTFKGEMPPVNYPMGLDGRIPGVTIIPGLHRFDPGPEALQSYADSIGLSLP